MSMRWNSVFWFSFVLAEALLIIMLAAGFSSSFVYAAGIVLVFGILKLMEDARSGKLIKEAPKVKRSLLNKLKKESN